MGEHEPERVGEASAIPQPSPLRFDDRSPSSADLPLSESIRESADPQLAMLLATMHEPPPPRPPAASALPEPSAPSEPATALPISATPGVPLVPPAPAAPE